MKTRITELLGIEIPVVQAPMGYIARAQLASAVSNAGGMGIIETSSGQLDEIKVEIAKMRDLTDRPWGVNIAQMLMPDATVIDFVIEHDVRFVTTSAGDPRRFTSMLTDAGITVFHVVPTLRGALKAVDAGVDGLIVEGVEGGGFKNARGSSTMVLTPLVRAAVEVPVIAAGGICDGVSMAAALTLGADGVQMGTRMLSASESPVHDNWKQAVIAAAETDTVLLNRFGRPGMRALRTELTAEMEHSDQVHLPGLDLLMEQYFGGRMDVAVPFGGQVMGRIDEVRPVADILRESWHDCQARLRSLGEAAG